MPRPFVIEFICHNVHLVRWTVADGRGRLRFVRPPWDKVKFQGVNSLTESEPPSEILSDWFFTEHDRVQWIVQAYIWGRHFQSHYAYGMIDCDRVSVVDHRERQLIDFWGKGVATPWRAYDALPPGSEKTSYHDSVPRIHIGQLRDPVAE